MQRKTWMLEFVTIINVCVWYPLTACYLLLYNPWTAGVPFIVCTLVPLIAFMDRDIEKRRRASRLKGFLGTSRQENALKSLVDEFQSRKKH
jgi:hypothetical protein